jgi:lipoyl-dependent peroxiredoxin
MALAERRAEVVREGDLLRGGGKFTVAMALSNVLAQGGTPPERLEISAVCRFDVERWKEVRVDSVDLDIRARVPGIDADGFQSAVEQAEQGYPVSNALRGNVDIGVNASLDEG